ncbi:MAG: TCR/Tet family MFS transporter [Bacteroidota bacterium]
MRDKKLPLIFIFITVILDISGLGIIIPVLPKMISSFTGGNMSTAAAYAGWLTFAYATVQFFSAPILGNLSDKYGRRPLLLLSLLSFGIDSLFMAFAPSLAWIFLGRILAGISGASYTVASAYVADISTPEKRSENFGLINAAFGMGFIIGPVIGGLLGKMGQQVPFLAAAGLSIANFIFGYFVLPESLPLTDRRPFNWKRANPVGALMHLRRFPAVAGLLTCITIFYISGHSMETCWTFYTMLKFNWDEQMIGISLGASGLIMALVQAVLIRLVLPKTGDRLAVYIGMCFSIIGFVLFAFAGSGTVMLLTLIPWGLGGLGAPAIMGLISNSVPANEQGELQGGLTSLMSVTAIPAPLIMSGLFAHYSKPGAEVYFPGAPFLLSAALVLIALLVAYLSMRHLPNHFQKPGDEPGLIPETAETKPGTVKHIA